MTLKELAELFDHFEELEVIVDSAVNPAEGLMMIRRKDFKAKELFFQKSEEKLTGVPPQTEEWKNENTHIPCCRMDVHDQVQQPTSYKIKDLQLYDGRKIKFKGEKMRKFEKTIQPGTKVWISGIELPGIVSRVSEQRYWIEIEGRVGSFQRQHLVRYSNKETA